MYNYLKYYNIPVTVVCTKSRQSVKKQSSKNKNVIVKELNLNNENDIILFSSITKKQVKMKYMMK